MVCVGLLNNLREKWRKSNVDWWEAWTESRILLRILSPSRFSYLHNCCSQVQRKPSINFSQPLSFFFSSPFTIAQERYLSSWVASYPRSEGFPGNSEYLSFILFISFIFTSSTCRVSRPLHRRVVSFRCRALSHTTWTCHPAANLPLPLLLPHSKG